MHEQLFDHIDLKPENIHVPDGTVHRDEVYDYCNRYEQAIEDAGGIDLQILESAEQGTLASMNPVR